MTEEQGGGNPAAESFLEKRSDADNVANGDLVRRRFDGPCGSSLHHREGDALASDFGYSPDRMGS